MLIPNATMAAFTVSNYKYPITMNTYIHVYTCSLLPIVCCITRTIHTIANVIVKLLVIARVNSGYNYIRILLKETAYATLIGIKFNTT